MTVPQNERAPIIVPPSVRRRAGIKPGEKLTFKASGGVITITARREAPDDEYTPEQRRVITRRLKQGMKDIEEGRYYGAFDSVDEMIQAIEGELKKRVAKKRTRTG